jgi:hypothetical protein
MKANDSFGCLVSTVLWFGNSDWGGEEVGDVAGFDTSAQAKKLHRTFVDYDPITGKTFRAAHRQQVSSERR